MENCQVTVYSLIKPMIAVPVDGRRLSSPVNIFEKYSHTYKQPTGEDTDA